MISTVFALTLSMLSADHIEAPVVPYAKAMEDAGRYRSPRNFDDTVEYYKRLFRSSGGIRWRNIINQPGIKAKHLQSLRKKTKWAGINIYETKGQVRIYVVKRKPAVK